jgi:hypothetical protein
LFITKANTSQPKSGDSMSADTQEIEALKDKSGTYKTSMATIK